MISTEAAAIVVSVARGLIKMHGRMDRLMAEKKAVESDEFLIPMPPESEAPTRGPRIKALRAYLKDSDGVTPDPLGAKGRKRLRFLLEQEPVPMESDDFYFQIFPHQRKPPLTSPDAEFIKELRRQLPTEDWDEPGNKGILMAAFYIAAGRKPDEQLGYPARVGLLLADVVAEFGAEYTALFVRDSNAQALVRSVLERFSEGDLEKFEQWSPLLRHALNATLNSLLDSRSVLAAHSDWAQTVFAALASARAESADADDYLLGLLRGSGYGRLIGEGMKLAGERLVSDQRGAFQSAAAAFLIEAAPLVKANENGFGVFFQEHWGDLLIGVANALAARGPALLEGKSPLMQQTLLAMLKQLSVTPGASYFTRDTTVKLAEVALGAVAGHRNLFKGAAGEARLRELIGSVAETLSDSGLRSTFSRAGLEHIVTSALSNFAEHPEWIITQPGLAREVVGGVLREIARSGSPDVEKLADAAVGGALNAISRHPDLTGTQFAPFLAGLAGQLAGVVNEEGLASLDAAAIAAAAAEAMSGNPELFARASENLASEVVAAVLRSSGSSKLATGATLVAMTKEVLSAVGRHGASLVENQGVLKLLQQLEAALAASLERASKELGRRLDRHAIPVVVGAVVSKLLRGELAELDAGAENFKKVFSELAETANA